MFFQLEVATRGLLLLATGLVLGAMHGAAPALAAPVTWHGNDGTNPTFWDILTTPNWNGSATTYAEGDAVTFDGTAVGYNVSIQTTVNPLSMVVNNSTATSYVFSNGDISGATGISFSGTRPSQFNQSSLSFAGGTTVNNLRVDYTPSGAGPHSFGSAAITLNNGGGSWFNYNPSTVGAQLTNDFIVNGTVTWRNPGSMLDGATVVQKNRGTSGVRTGNIILNGTLALQIGSQNLPCAGVCDQGVNVTETILLTGNRTIIGGERFYTAATTISGDIGHTGSGPYDLELRHDGDNSDWEFFISDTNVSDPNGWNVKNIRRTSPAASSPNGTVVFRVDETQFFNNMTANGGSLFVTDGGIRFHDEFEGNGNSLTANINFSLVLDSTAQAGNGTGIRHNNLINVISGGTLAGNGTYRSGPDGGGAFANALDINVLAGGTLSPGNHEVNGGVGIMTINGDVAFTTGGTLRIQIDGQGSPGTDYDQLIVQDAPAAGTDGNVTGLSNATLLLDFGDLSFEDLDGAVFTILTSVNDLTGQSFGEIVQIGAGNANFDIIYGNGFIMLQNFTEVVPEPSTYLLLGLGSLALVWQTRRRTVDKS